MAESHTKIVTTNRRTGMVAVSCSCKQFKTKPGSPSKTDRAFQDHRKAKEAQA